MPIAAENRPNTTRTGACAEPRRWRRAGIALPTNAVQCYKSTMPIPQWAPPSMNFSVQPRIEVRDMLPRK